MSATAPNPAEHTAVLVVGAGPAGLAAAAELGLHGVGCIVVEPRTEVSHLRPRAKTTSIRTMEHFRRWGVADALREAAPLPVAWSQRVTFCESLSGRRITDFDNAFGLSVERDDRYAETGQQVPQPVVEDVLRSHVRRLPGVKLRLGHRATDLTQDDDGVTVTVHDDSGSCYAVRADYVFGCDGAGGVVRELIGIRYAGRSDPRPNFNVVFRAPGLDTRLGPAVQYWVVGERAAGLLGRLDLHGTWWAVVPGIEAADGAGRAAELIAGLVGHPIDHEIVATDPWTARMLVAERFRDRRVFLVGESAHLNPPWGGHGFNTCVGDAVNIAWKVAAVEHGWASVRILDSYEAERRGVVEQTVKSAEANMAALANALPQDAETIQKAKRAEFHSLGLVLGYSYAGSPIVQPTGPYADDPDDPDVADATDATDMTDLTAYTPTTEPGSRLPHRWLRDGSSLYDLIGPGFTLVGPVSTDPAGVARFVEAARTRGVPLTVLEPSSAEPGRRREAFLLVRPDQHIAWRSDTVADIDIDWTIAYQEAETV